MFDKGLVSRLYNTTQFNNKKTVQFKSRQTL